MSLKAKEKKIPVPKLTFHSPSQNSSLVKASLRKRSKRNISNISDIPKIKEKTNFHLPFNLSWNPSQGWSP